MGGSRGWGVIYMLQLHTWFKLNPFIRNFCNVYLLLNRDYLFLSEILCLNEHLGCAKV